MESALIMRAVCGGLSREKVVFALLILYWTGCQHPWLEQVEYLIWNRKPTIQVAMTTLTVGRAFLPRPDDSPNRLVWSVAVCQYGVWW